MPITFEVNNAKLLLFDVGDVKSDNNTNILDHDSFKLLFVHENELLHL